MKLVKMKGGLGNQMFQYAFYKRLKLESEEVFLNLEHYRKTKEHNGLEIEKIFNLKLEINIKLEWLLRKNWITNFFRSIMKKIKIMKVYSIPDIIYEEKFLRSPEKIVVYSGYWQTEKYFKQIETEIRKVFFFPELDSKNKEIEKRIVNEESVAIHVRRGDYINHPTLGGLVTKKYYIQAIEYIEKHIINPKYYIFSDDIEWCKRELNLDRKGVTFINHNKGEESYKDMQLMSQCKHNIIPNSSFSWWGAWLNKNPNKIVIAPKRWFTKESGYRYEDIVPKSWIKIANEE